MVDQSKDSSDVELDEFYCLALEELKVNYWKYFKTF